MRRWQEEFRLEMARADKALAEGLENRARAAARRAANVVLAEYLARQGHPMRGTIQQRAQVLFQSFHLPEDVEQVIRRMIGKVRPTCDDPVDLDLIADARWLAKTLLGEDPLESGGA